MPRDKIRTIQQILTELEEIKTRPMQHGMADLNAWMDQRLPEAKYLLQELVNELDPDYPDQQVAMNYEQVVLIERRASA